MIFRTFTLIYLTGFLMFTSCTNDLNIAQKSQFTSLSMWTSESDAASAVNGMFTRLRSTLSTSLPVYGDYRAALYGGGMMSLKDYDNMAQNNISRDMEGTNWADFYTTINECNLILKYAPIVAFSKEDTRSEVMANAYFVRALCYFYIARIWGDAPVLTSGYESDSQADLYPTRNPAAEVYARVEADLTEAGRLMPAAVISVHKASLAAINMLKADYYLWKAKRLSGGRTALLAAETAVNDVLASTHTLAPDFADIFGTDNEGNSEIIFSFVYSRNEYEGGYPSYYLAPEQYLEDETIKNNPVPVGSHQQYVSITDAYEEFLSAIPSDTRAATSFGTYQDGSTRWRWINKYKGEWTSETRYFTSDIIVYRLAEAILLKAEIENALGNTPNAIGELNHIAFRAYGTEGYYPLTLTAAEIDKAIIDETLREFVAEGKSWWTMVRFGTAFTLIPSLAGRENETNILLWPVSSDCINTNPNIQQTDGYN